MMMMMMIAVVVVAEGHCGDVCVLHSGTISVNSVRTAYTAPGDNEILDLDDTLYLGGLPEDRAGLIFPTEVRQDNLGRKKKKQHNIRVTRPPPPPSPASGVDGAVELWLCGLHPRPVCGRPKQRHPAAGRGPARGGREAVVLQGAPQAVPVQPLPAQRRLPRGMEPLRLRLLRHRILGTLLRER